MIGTANVNQIGNDFNQNESHRDKHSLSNGQRKHAHRERMTINSSELSPHMSQEDVRKLLRLDDMPSCLVFLRFPFF